MKSILIFTLLLPIFAFGQQTTLYDTSYYTSGDKKIMEISTSKGVLKGGLKTGVWMTWYANGKVADSCQYIILAKNKIRFFADDESTWKYNDTIKLQKDLKKEYSIPTGHYVSYYSNGRIQSIGNYSNYARIEFITLEKPDGSMVYMHMPPREVKIGIWKEFGENGKMESKVDYKNGESPSGVELPIE